jgi:hypothetical protein
MTFLDDIFDPSKIFNTLTFGLFKNFSIKNLIIKFIKFITFGLIKFDGKSINLSFFKMILYTIIPGGQLLMRFFELNGSLDKLSMLFPLFLIPPFSFPTIFLANWGLYKEGKGGNPIDGFILIPILVKFVTLLLFNKISPLKGLIINIVVVMLSLILCNLLRYTKRTDCNEDNTDTVKVLHRSIIDSFIMYGGGMAAQIIINFIPFIGELYELIEAIPIGGMDKIVERGIWGIGAFLVYFLNNMFYNVESKICNKSPSGLRNIIGLAAIIFAVFKEGENKLF